MRRGGRQAAVKLACVPISRTILAFLPAAPRQISALNDTSTSAAPRQFAPPLQLLPLIRLLRLKPADTESPDCELQIATFHMQHASEPCLLRQQTSPAVPPHNEPASPARPPWTGALDANEPGLDSKVYESRHVHHVYDQIASHFSSTRYKPWPLVERFLTGLPDGSVGLDVGCGNGKYLAVNPNVFIVASDSSVVADNLDLPHSSASFDFAISIAVIHHLSTPARRVEAVAAILETLRFPSEDSTKNGLDQNRGGKALMYVWALEQKGSRRGWDEGDHQDVMVPWVTKRKNHQGLTEETTFHRYYHLYRRGELEKDIIAAGGAVIESGYERENWWAIAARKSSA
ncbi:MAG: hypothetical protein LQ347_001721 [Umbilicaria vellea]|nr:MAG: hypothetical protein LQ347_001721 [Umbilicaria vellea]